MDYPKNIMQKILWNFKTKTYQSKDEFAKDLVKYNERILKKYFTFDLEANALNSPKIVIQYIYFDSEGEEVEPSFVLEAGNKIFFPQSELLFKVHNIVSNNMEGQEHIYFEGFMLWEGENPNYPDWPLYFLLLGS